ncbi:hypothetical protein G6F56_006310 [Rhizopus delemar]|nr:hypothetical protein G6F56_006310 [Rhizopus delemar]
MGCCVENGSFNTEFPLISSIMSFNKENIEEEINSSVEKTQQRVRQFVQISFEKEACDRVAKLKESLVDDPHRSITTVPATTVLQKERDNIFLDGCTESVSTLIKDKAVTLRQSYHSLDSNGKAIITLGLNSILDLSFKYPTTIYKELKRLGNIYDHELDISHNDTSFCVHFLLQIMSIIKHQPHLFLEEVDTSEWDYVVGFWGIVTGRLFHGSGLRLKWGDTHLSVYDTVSDLILKVDLRILHDRIRQGQNVETDVGAMEAAEEQPGDAKYIFDRCKVLLESKAMIDRFLLDGFLVDSVDSLQICGLEAHFYENHLSEARSRNVSAKRSYSQLPRDDLVVKQESVRGSWNPTRSSKSPPPPTPENLFGKH